MDQVDRIFFLSRRATCVIRIITDSATNFKISKLELPRHYELIRNLNYKLANYLTSQAIEWKFIPPRLSNFIRL